jgi:hypothetical protein
LHELPNCERGYLNQSAISPGLVPECKVEILMMNGLGSSLEFLPYTVGTRGVGARLEQSVSWGG